ncbi:hypothetical protein [Pseudomonas sp. A-RE-26]|uniref:hypothetical protein n=1 Tax=Pseudomonas sp. A-RE-26 TaxID=2832402 RepID=UPI001CC10B63|nr:hypothetical protein [Pseudomonas sp. A-RE-26]
MAIVLWQEGCQLNFDPTQTLFVRPQHKEDLALELAYHPPEIWPRIIELLPLAEQWPSVVEVLINLKELQVACASPTSGSEVAALLPLFDEALHTILIATTELVVCLKDMDASAVANASKRILKILQSTTLLPPRTIALYQKIVLFLEHLSEGCLRELTLPALFFHSTTNVNQKRWWQNAPSFKSTCSTALTNFDAVVNGGPPDDIKLMRAWVDSLLLETAKLYQTQIGQSEASSFRAASAFFAVHADRFYLKGHTVMGLLALHRSAEWLLAAKCADQGLLDFSNSHGILISSSNSLISFSDMLDELTNAGIGLQGITNELRNLNKWRNVLAYTHHMSAPTDSIAQQIYNTVRPNLKHLANREWVESETVYNTPFPLKIEHLLDPNGDLRSSFNVISSKDLEI